MNSGRRKEKVNRSEKYTPLYPYKTGRFPPSIRLIGDERYDQEKLCLDANKKSCASKLDAISVLEMQSRNVSKYTNLQNTTKIKMEKAIAKT
jgi:hypothetical protein